MSFVADDDQFDAFGIDQFASGWNDARYELLAYSRVLFRRGQVITSAQIRMAVQLGDLGCESLHIVKPEAARGLDR